MMKYTRTVFVILALVLLICGGCSRVTYAYNHGDWLLRYWISDYTSFNARQKDEIRQDVADYMLWHRKYALPEYAAFLQDVYAVVNRDGALDVPDVVHVRAKISRLYKLTVTPAIRPAAHLLSTLDDRQIEELRSTLAKKNLKGRDETLSGSEQDNLGKRAKKHIHFIEDLVGHLSSEQEKQIREMSLRIPFTTMNCIDQREAEQAGLISLLTNHEGEDKIAEYFSQWLSTLQTPTSPQQLQITEAYDSAMNEMVVRIFELLTKNQKEHLLKKITAYLDDIQKLHPTTETADASLPP